MSGQFRTQGSFLDIVLHTTYFFLTLLFCFWGSARRPETTLGPLTLHAPVPGQRAQHTRGPRRAAAARAALLCSAIPRSPAVQPAVCHLPMCLRVLLPAAPHFRVLTSVSVRVQSGKQTTPGASGGKGFITANQRLRKPLSVLGPWRWLQSWGEPLLAFGRSGRVRLRKLPLALARLGLLWDQGGDFEENASRPLVHDPRSPSQPLRSGGVAEPLLLARIRVPDPGS